MNTETGTTQEHIGAPRRLAKEKLRKLLAKWVRVEAVYMVLVVALVCSPQAFAGSTTLQGALQSLLTLLQAAGAAMIGLACVKWGLDFLQGGGASREAFTSIGIGAGLILGAQAIGSSI